MTKPKFPTPIRHRIRHSRTSKNLSNSAVLTNVTKMTKPYQYLIARAQTGQREPFLTLFSRRFALERRVEAAGPARWNNVVQPAGVP
jgi:hypothetical protein